MVARIDVPRDGILLLNEAYQRGWEVRLDGRKVPRYRANLLMQAVYVKKGRHEVSMRYRNVPYQMALGLWMLTWLLALAILLEPWFPRAIRSDPQTPS